MDDAAQLWTTGVNVGSQVKKKKKKQEEEVLLSVGRVCADDDDDDVIQQSSYTSHLQGDLLVSFYSKSKLAQTLDRDALYTGFRQKE